MNSSPLSFIAKPIPIKSWLLAALMGLYCLLSLCAYFQWVAPSLDGRSDQHIAADSATYIYFADSLREGRRDPLVLAALSSFPNTAWTPVLIALALKSNLIMALTDYLFFVLALLLLKETYSFSMPVFAFLLLMNATTTISLLSVNKEIIDLLSVSLFLFARKKGRWGLLVLSLMIAFLNRYEVSVVMLIFLVVQTKLNPLRRRRGMTLAFLILALSILLPLVASGALAKRSEEASEGGLILILDSLEMHYLYAIAVIPKIAENLFGYLLNLSTWKALDDFSDVANSYIVLLNNLATAVVLVVLFRKRQFTTRSDLVYFAMMGGIFMAISLVIQPRYFYFVYVLLCLQAARKSVNRTLSNSQYPQFPETANA